MKRYSKVVLPIGVYAVAWLLPTTNDQSLLRWHALPGWEATRVALSPIWRYRYHGELITWEGISVPALLHVLSALTNLIFVSGTVAALITPRAVGRKLEVFVWTAAIVNCHWVLLSWSDVEWLRIGYYAWVTSYALLGIVLHRMVSSIVTPASTEIRSPHLVS